MIEERIRERRLLREQKQHQLNGPEIGNGLVSSKKRRLAFLDMLLESLDNGDLTVQDVREEVDTFMFEVNPTWTNSSI